MADLRQFAASMSRTPPIPGRERTRQWRERKGIAATPAVSRPGLRRAPVTQVSYRDCIICNGLFVARATNSHKRTCSVKCSGEYRAARSRARYHIRHIAESDITPEQEHAMRKRARKCPLCGGYMTSKPSQPNSKHLDHIVPLNEGGTHTHGNVRIICADCNLKRPKDGSDYSGPITLWAQGDVPVSRPDRRRERAANRETCGKGLHPWVAANIIVTGSGKKLCKLCRKATEQRNGKRQPQRQCKCGAMFPAPGRQFMCPACIDAAARQAAELHARGGLTWKQVAEQVGYRSGNGEGARYAAKRIGYVPVPPAPKPAGRLPCGRCGELVPDARGQHTPRCDACQAAAAWEAVALRQDGCTLRYIADQLGYDSITSVTNLMATVVVTERRMGRPRKLHQA